MVGGDYARYRCSFCGAEIEVPKTFAYATCPYCGTTFRTDNPSAEVEHFVFASAYDKNSAYKLVKKFALMQVGIAEDFENSVDFDLAYQYLVPLYIYEINVKAVCKESDVRVEGQSLEADVYGGEEVAQIVKLATDRLPIHIPKGYSFPARGRRYFRPSLIKDGVYVQPTADPEAIFKLVKEPYLSKALSEAEMACKEGYDVVDNSRFVGIAHYPFWLVKYVYRGREYRAVVDAADGTVLYLEYPIGTRFRALGLAWGMAIAVGASAVGGALSAIAFSNALIGVIGGLISSLPAVALVLWRLLRSRGVYRFKPSEEASLAPIR